MRHSKDPLVGRTLGEYTIVERIGEGGFGKVYRARQAALSREAVIKVLNLETRGDDDVARRFTAEAQVASRLDHPYAAHVYGFGAESDGLLWIAMELVRGAPLDVHLAVHGPLKLERFVLFFERVCEVVHTAHEQGIVHRDLKPANIMVLARAGRLLPKLLDFGIAKVLSAVSSPPASGPLMVPALLESERGLEATAPMARAPESDTMPKLVGFEAAQTDNEILGSPRYMAPEQWASPRDIDARADLYALGAVAYETLTGKAAFAGTSIASVLQAHESGLPKLPPGFPPAVDAVLARATASLPADRYASALELADAMRAAAGLATTRALPQLDRGLRTRYLEHAPEPIAEAVAALDSAANVHAMRDGIGHVARAIARWLGLLAISCRTRIGAGDGDSAAVQQLLRRLRHEGLRDGEWLDLARELVRPFEARPHAHPIEELASCLASRPEEPDASAAIRELLELTRDTEPGEAQLRARMPELVKQLARTLDLVRFVTDYELVVPEAGRAERFVGVRRVPRARVGAAELSAFDGSPLLLDADGAAVLVLWPLVQCVPPTAGAERELFFLEGPGRHGARLVAARHAFEIHDATLWDWFGASLIEDADRAVAETVEERPYRGLASFTEADSHLFYGREREVDRFVNRLRVTPLLAVVGPSGAGKSSFVQAGVLPALGWRSVIVRPGTAPIATLAAKLGVPPGELVERAGPALRAGGGPGVVLVVDQLEELFTLCADAAEREQFARAITNVARFADERVRVIVTLRDDFLMRAESIASLRERFAVGLHLLGTPNREDLIRILVEPARGAGYALEDEALVAEMVDAVADRPGALALLSFTATALWDQRDRHFRHLSRKAYEAIGGVGGALATHAEETLGRMPADQRALVRDAFRRLVTADGTRAVLARAELVQVLGGGSKAETVIESLVGARLLAASETEQGELVEVAHEALLAAWPRLVTWRREDAEGARLRDQLRAAAAQWHERGRPTGLLWRGDALAELQIWRGRTPGALTELEGAFTAAALREKARGMWIRRALLAAAFGVLAIGLVGALWLSSQTRRERGRAVASLAALHQEQGRLALVAGRPASALVYLAEASRLGARGAALEVMLGAAVQAVESVQFSLEGHTGALWSGAYSHDGRHLATAGSDGDARIWRADTGAAFHVLRGHGKDVRALAFAPDDRHVATTSWDGTARIWDVATGRLVHTLALDHAGIALAFSPDGGRLVTAAGDVDDRGGARIWDVRTGALVTTLAIAAHTAAVAWSHDGRTILTGSQDGARTWDASTGAPVATLVSTGVQHVAFARDDRRVVLASRAGDLAIWDTTTRAKLVDLAGQTTKIRELAISPDGQLLACASADQSARVWDLTTGKLRHMLSGSDARVTAVAFSGRGDRIVTGSADGSSRVWDTASGTLVALRDGHTSGINTVGFHVGGAAIVTASADGTAKVWRVDATSIVRPVEGKPEHVAVARSGEIATGGRTSPVHLWTPGLELIRTLPPSSKNPAFSSDASLVVASTRDEHVTVWRTHDGVEVHTFAGQSQPATAQFSADGRRIVSVSETDGTARIWDLTGARAPIVMVHPTKALSSAAWSPDDRTVVTAGRDGGVRLWDTASGRLTTTMAFTKGWVTSATFSHDGARIASAHQEAVAAIWDARTHTRLGILEGHAREVSSVRFSSDDQLVVTTGGDGTVRIWDATRYKLLLVLTGHRAETIDAAFAGERVVSASWDGTIRMWDVPRDRRTPADVQRTARCRVALVLDANGSLAPKPVDRTACPPTS